MKKILTATIILGVMLCASGCSADTAQESSSQTTTSASTEAVSTEEAVDSSVNEGELKTGTYSGSSAYSEGEFSMEWNYTFPLMPTEHLPSQTKQARKRVQALMRSLTTATQ